MVDLQSILESKMHERCISKAEMCKRLGVRHQRWCYISVDPKFSMLQKMCDIIGISVGELFSEEQTVEVDGTIVCPHCKKGFMVTAIKE